jgi:hypothetical protein
MKLHTVFFRGKYRRNETDNVFCTPFPSVNPSIIIFFFITNGLSDGQKITDEAFPSVILLVN